MHMILMFMKRVSSNVLLGIPPILSCSMLMLGILMCALLLRSGCGGVAEVGLEMESCFSVVAVSEQRLSVGMSK